MQEPKVELDLIPVSKAVDASKPAAFLVFYHSSTLYDYEVKFSERDAISFAESQAEEKWMEMPEGSEMPSWPIYALWPSDWPLDQTKSVVSQAEGLSLPRTRPAPPPEQLEARKVRRVWRMFEAMHEDDLRRMTRDAGIDINGLDYGSLLRQAVVRWFGGFPPSIEELDRLQGRRPVRHREPHQAVVKFIWREYWNREANHVCYSDQMHTLDDKPAIHLHELESVFEKIGVRDGENVEITVRRTGEFLFPGIIWKHTEPHTYSPVKKDEFESEKPGSAGV